jgi:hypothetical protein
LTMLSTILLWTIMRRNRQLLRQLRYRSAMLTFLLVRRCEII